MNSMERIQSTLQGKVKDHHAVSLTLSLYGARLTQCPLEKYYTDATAYAKGQEAIREFCRSDILFGPFALPLEGHAFGSEIQFLKKNPPNLKRPVFESSDDIYKLILPDLESHPTLTYIFESIQKMKEVHGDEIPIAGITLNPIDLPIMLFGIHGWLETLLFFEQEARQLIEMLIPYCIQKINRFFDSGATFVVMPCAFTNPSILTREIIEEITLPIIRDFFQQIHGPLVIHSSGAPLLPFLDLFAELPQVIGFVLNAGEDIHLARQKVGPEMVLIGNVEGPSLVNRSTEDVLRECQKVLFEFGEDPRFILGSTGADIAYDTPIETIHAFRRASVSTIKGE
ncbi:uroporphyrinogen decarboxylase family protein [bacterium]